MIVNAEKKQFKEINKYFSGFKRGRSLPSLGEEEFSQGAFAGCLKIFCLLNLSEYLHFNSVF